MINFGDDQRNREARTSVMFSRKSKMMAKLVIIQLVEPTGQVSEVEIEVSEFNQLCICENFDDELDHLHLLRSKGCRFEK